MLSPTTWIVQITHNFLEQAVTEMPRSTESVLPYSITEDTHVCFYIKKAIYFQKMFAPAQAEEVPGYQNDIWEDCMDHQSHTIKPKKVTTMVRCSTMQGEESECEHLDDNLSV